MRRSCRQAIVIQSGIPTLLIRASVRAAWAALVAVIAEPAQ